MRRETRRGPAAGRGEGRAVTALDGIARAQGAMGALQSAVGSVVTAAAESEQRALTAEARVAELERVIAELERDIAEPKRDLVRLEREAYRRGYSTGYAAARRGAAEDADMSLRDPRSKVRVVA